MNRRIVNIHVWGPHDTWWSVAATYTGTGLNWPVLWEANRHVTNPNDVAVGTRLRIPRELQA